MAEQAMCARRGVPFDMALKGRLLGTHLDEAGAILAEWLDEDPSRASDLGRELLAAYREAVDTHGVDPMPGAVALVSALHGMVPMAVASNTPADDTRRVLAMSPLPDVFTAVVCAGPGIPPKPEPDVYRAACAALGVRPQQAVAIEDSAVGAAAAQAAGMRVIAVPSPSATPQADLIVASLADLTLDVLLNR